MNWNRPKIILALVAAVVLVGAVAGGRHLLSAGSASPSASGSASASAASAPATRNAAAVPTTTAPISASPSPNHQAAGSLAPTNGVGAPTSAQSSTATSGSAGAKSAGLPDIPTFALTPQVVHTATVDLRVGRGRLDSVLRTVAALAGTDGGYVDSSSVSGGTARRSPDAGTVTFRVLDSDFADAITTVANLGTVENQKIKGKDVTIQVAQNAASISVLQDEVTLLQKKLGEATDLGTFLQIQGQLFPVEQQLQQLQAAQAVLEISASLATITVGLTAPGGSVVPAAKPRPHVDAATTAWRYLRHNSLAVLDGLAVAFGWALPVLIVLALVGLITLWVIRRRRHVVTPA